MEFATMIWYLGILTLRKLLETIQNKLIFYLNYKKNISQVMAFTLKTNHICIKYNFDKYFFTMSVLGAQCILVYKIFSNKIPGTQLDYNGSMIKLTNHSYQHYILKIPTKLFESSVQYNMIEIYSLIKHIHLYLT